MHPALTVHEAADKLGTTATHVRRLARERKLPHYRIGGVLRFAEEDVAAFIAEAYVGTEDAQ